MICKQHRWPSDRRGEEYMGGSISSLGRVSHEQCNNCLALRVKFEVNTVSPTGEFYRAVSIKIVEPDLDR